MGEKEHRQNPLNLYSRYYSRHAWFFAKVYWIHEIAIFLTGNNERRMYLRQSRVQCIPMTQGEKDFKKTPVRRTNTFQSISPRAAVFHVPFTRSDPLLIPTPFVCLPIFVGRAISPGYFSISFDEHLRSTLAAPCRPILNDINPISFYYLAYLRRSTVYVQ